MFGLSDDVIHEIQDIFRKHKNIRKVLIFGSRSKGNYREGSDIDLAAIGDNIDLNQILDVSMEIDDLGLLYHVDLINYEKFKGTPLAKHIDRIGQVFYAAS